MWALFEMMFARERVGGCSDTCVHTEIQRVFTGFFLTVFVLWRGCVQISFEDYYGAPKVEEKEERREQLYIP